MEKEMHSKLKSLLTPEISGLGYELVNLEWLKEGGAWILRLFINTSGGNVSLRDCETVSRHVDKVLDQSDIVPHAYTLEVSSPGLDSSKIEL